MKRQYLIQKIEELGKDVFTVNDLRKMFPDESNLKVSIKRMLDAGVLQQVCRGVYTARPDRLSVEAVATQLYCPSYISFESALSRYGVINQGLYGLTLATTRHTKVMTLAGVECRYSKISARLFFGYELKDGAYIAQGEKAFLDMLYLISQGKRSDVDVSGWYLDILDEERLKEYLKSYNQSVVNRAEELLEMTGGAE